MLKDVLKDARERMDKAVEVVAGQTCVLFARDVPRRLSSRNSPLITTALPPH